MRFLLLAVALSACNGSSSGHGDAADVCITPVVGATCSLDDVACFPGGCAGYTWGCNANTHVWEQFPTLHKPCIDAGGDALTE